MKELDEIRAKLNAGDYDWENQDTWTDMDRMERVIRFLMKHLEYCTHGHVEHSITKAGAMMRGEK